jgi:hypothetical protein
MLYAYGHLYQETLSENSIIFTPNFIFFVQKNYLPQLDIQDPLKTTLITAGSVSSNG